MLRIALYLFENVEALDFAGPYEVFTTASRVAQRLWPEQSAPFSLFSVAQTASPVRARAGLSINPDTDFAALTEAVDVLIVPGGVVDEQLNNAAVIDWIRSTSAGAQLSASVCTGAFLLAKAGVITQGEVTTHWEDQADLAQMFPALRVLNGPRWVELGTVVTSAGIAAGIDMCLHLVGRLHSVQLAEATARQMDYPWQPQAVI